MNKKNSSEGKHLLQIRRNHRRWAMMVAVLGILITTGTFFVLKYSATAQTYQKHVLDCQQVSGTVSHVHNDDCYYKGDLVCPLQEIQPHQHTEECWQYEPVLICGLEESYGHQHTDACYIPVMELACGLEESEGDETHPAHRHSQACYRPVMELVCGLEETAGDEQHEAHWHSDACYQEAKQLICGMEAGEGAHFHSDECWDIQNVMVCGQEELPVHVHGPECFRVEEMTEEEIAAMDAAAAERAGEDTNTPAEGQDGTGVPEDGQEQQSNAEEPGEVTDNTNDTDTPAEGQEGGSVPENLADLPMQTTPFSFASRADNILVTVEAPAEAFPAGTEMKVRAIYDEQVLSDAADAVEKDENVEGKVVQVQAVDISFWYNGKEFEPMKPIRVVMTPVETPDFDAQTVVHVDDAGEAALIEQEDVAVPEAAFEVEEFSVYCLVYTKLEATVLASDGNNYKITVTAPDDAPFPENAQLWVSEILAGSNAYGITYNEYLTRSEYALGWEAGSASYVRMFDIFVGDQFGNKLTLTSPVDVKIQLLDREADKESGVVHFGAKTEVLAAETQGQSVSFEANGFSVYAILGTETIAAQYITANGETYNITVSYGPEAMIPEGAELKITEIPAPVAEETAEEVPSEYSDYVSKTEEALQGKERVVFARFFDITIIKDGAEIQPVAPVEVKIEMADALNAESVKAVHIKNEVEVLEATQVASETMESAVSFEASGFSIYGVVATETITTQYITADGETYTITVTYDSRAGIPEGATLEVSELVNDNKKYTDYVEKAAEALADGEETPFVNSARLFDISIMADGRKVEPKAPVEVRIEYAYGENLNETSEVGAVHFIEGFLKTDTEVLEVTVQGEEGKVDSVTFSADSFSIYAVVIIDKDAGTFCFEDENYKVTVTYTREANIPIGTELTVREITPEEDRYWELRKDTLEKINEGLKWEDTELTPDPRKGIADAVFFDISLNYEGKEIEPDVPLQVDIEYKDCGILVPTDESTGIIHFAKNGTETIDAVNVQYASDEDGNRIAVSYEYDQDSFSEVGSYSTGKYVEINEGTIIYPSAGIMAAPILRAAGDSSISAAKTITDTDGDGIYELALSVTGQSEQSSTTSVTKSNVVIVVDVSGSMTSNQTYSVYTGAGTTSGTYYGKVNGNYIELTWRRPNNYSEYRWQYRSNNTWYNYTGDVFFQETRLAAEKRALKELVAALLANNEDRVLDGVDLNDIIEITLIKFAFAVETNSYNGTSTLIRNVNTQAEHDQIDNIIDNLWGGGGTNWEKALQVAKTEADAYKTAQPDEAVSVIFVTDGVPTSWGNTNEAGQETVTNTHTGWNAASDDARALITSGYTVYDIFAFGTDTEKYTNTGWYQEGGNWYNNDGDRTDADYLRSLTNYAYSGTGTYANTALSAAARPYFFNASDTSALQDAFAAIINSISGNVGYGGVMVDDGVTIGVTNTSVTVEGTVNTDMFKYAIKTGSTTLATVHIDGNNATFTINDTEYQATGQTVTTDINGTTHTNTVFSVTVGDKEYKMSPATFDSNGKIQWDLAGIGIIENGYTYELSFEVWPNQASFDMVADLNNGVKTLDQIKAEVIASQGQAAWDQIEQALVSLGNGKYSIRTNYEQFVDYYTVDTETNEQTGETTTTYTAQPRKELGPKDPVPLTSTEMDLRKLWDDSLDQAQLDEILWTDYPTNTVSSGYHVKLHVWKADTLSDLHSQISSYAEAVNGSYAQADDHDYLAKTLGWNGSEYVWVDSLEVAPGTMIEINKARGLGFDVDEFTQVSYNGITYVILESGHYYTVTEEDIDRHFELNAIDYHPMLVDGVLSNVTFKADGTVENIIPMSTVDAANTLKGGINVLKRAFDGETEIIATDDIFTVQVTVNNPDGTPYLDWDYRIYYGDNNPLKTDTVYRSTHYFGTQAAMDASGSTGQVDPVNGGSNVISLDLYIGDTVRIINVPAGVTYSVVETKVNGEPLNGGAAGNYVFNTVKYEISQGSADSYVDDTKVPHAVHGNSSSQATVYNRVPTQKIGIKKIGNNQKTNTLSGVTFKLYKDAELTNQVLKDALGNDIGTNGVLTTGSDGKAEIGTLLAGTYYLVETGLGENTGYNMLTDAIVITVNSDSSVSYDRRVSYIQIGYTPSTADTNHVDGAGLLIEEMVVDGLTCYHYTITVNNSTGVELPMTGGPGVELLEAIGGIMMALAFTVLVIRRRRMA